MSYDNVKLWFAKNQDENIVTIDDINDENKKHTYSCPMCASNLIPKATKSVKTTSHFAHVDASKCNAESMVHWWFKNKFLEKGDSFVVVSDRERKYICKEVLVERSYEAADKAYRPDVTVTTECGNTIYFEMDYSNKKQVKDYLDIWLELKDIVVEVDIKKLMGRDNIPVFRALFYNGKCFNIKKNDLYYNTIGKYKEEKLQGTIDYELKDRIRKLDWFWNDVIRFKNQEVDIEHMTNLIDCFEGKERFIVHEVLYKPSCNDLLMNYLNCKTDRTYSLVVDSLEASKEKYLPFVHKRVNSNTKKGFIEVKSLAERTWKYFNVERYSVDAIISETKEEMRKNDFYIQNGEAVDEYNDNVKKVKNKIINNSDYSDLVKHLDDLNRGYKLNLRMSEIYDKYKLINMEELDIFEIKIVLNCGLQVCSEFSAKITNSNSEVDNLISALKNKLNPRLKQKKLIKNFPELDEMSLELEDRYSMISLHMGGYIDKDYKYCINFWMNDHRISIDENIYIWIDGFGYSYKNRMKTDTTSNLSILKSEITKMIDEKIKSKTRFRCVGCTNIFTMEVNELKFYFEKKLNLPKRCKKCRATNRK